MKNSGRIHRTPAKLIEPGEQRLSIEVKDFQSPLNLYPESAKWFSLLLVAGNTFWILCLSNLTLSQPLTPPNFPNLELLLYT